MESLQNLAKKWPSNLVAREEVGTFSGGVLNCRTMANLDSLGKGPERIRIGRKVVYEVGALIEWLENRTEQL